MLKKVKRTLNVLKATPHLKKNKEIFLKKMFETLKIHILFLYFFSIGLIEWIKWKSILKNLALSSFKQKK